MHSPCRHRKLLLFFQRSVCVPRFFVCEETPAAAPRASAAPLALLRGLCINTGVLPVSLCLYQSIESLPLSSPNFLFSGVYLRVLPSLSRHVHGREHPPATGLTSSNHNHITATCSSTSCKNSPLSHRLTGTTLPLPHTIYAQWLHDDLSLSGNKGTPHLPSSQLIVVPSLSPLRHPVVL